jgi:hypothetical protein
MFCESTVIQCPHESHDQSLPRQHCPPDHPAHERWHEHIEDYRKLVIDFRQPG